MNKIIGLAIIIIFSSCSEKQSDITEIVENEIITDDFREITNSLSITQFEIIKLFILKNGDQQTYCNMYNYNPHFSFEGFETYLNPETLNINCDPNISDFNVIVIQDLKADPQYYRIRIVRKNDALLHPLPEEMKEEKTYLLKYYDYDLNSMYENLQAYLETINEAVNNR